MAGVVIRLSPRAFGETSASGDTVSAGAAALDKRVAETAAAANIGGMEFFFGIPGTIGGALRMNAGANGAETRDVLIEATGVGRDGRKHRFTNADMKFAHGWMRCKTTAKPRSRSGKRPAARPSRIRREIAPGS